MHKHLIVGVFAHHSGKTTLAKKIMGLLPSALYYKPFSGSNWRNRRKSFPKRSYEEHWISKDLLEIYSKQPLENRLPHYCSANTVVLNSLRFILNPFHIMFTPINISSNWFIEHQNTQFDSLLSITGANSLSSLPFALRCTNFPKNVKTISSYGKISNNIYLTDLYEKDTEIVLGGAQLFSSLKNLDQSLNYKPPRYFSSFDLMATIFKQGGILGNNLFESFKTPFLVESHDDAALPVDMEFDHVWVVGLEHVRLYEGYRWKMVVETISSIGALSSVSVSQILPHVKPTWQGNMNQISEILPLG